MELLAKKEYLNELFLHYQSLLTKKQAEYFTMYYLLDYSLFEIAELMNVSRNAVFDQLKHIEKNLLLFEEKLHLADLRKKRLAYLEEYQKTNNQKYLDKIRKLDE